MLRTIAKAFGGRNASKGQQQRFRPELEGLEARLVMDVKNPLSALPVLNSLPGAAATIYLDFNGHDSRDWFFLENGVKSAYNPGKTPAFDEDGDATTFSNQELNDIERIWARVVEDYAPFNVNVTTVDPGSFANTKALHVIIGGDATGWKGKTPGEYTDFFTSGSTGISSIGSFSDSAPNEVYVWSKLIVRDANQGYTDGDGRAIQLVPAVATTISHEAGHSFGLRHHSQYDAAGNRLKTYDPGSAARTPIMGDNLVSDRSTWANGSIDLGSTVFQDDMAVIAGSANGFGYRAQDHGQTFGTADVMTVGFAAGFGTFRSATGIIGKTSDADTFRFSTTGGLAVINAKGIAEGTNLDAKIDLYQRGTFYYRGAFRYYQTLIASADSADSLNASISMNLSAGTYFAVVRSHGSYGDVGQYSLTVNTEVKPIRVPILVIPPYKIINPNPPDPGPLLVDAVAKNPVVNVLDPTVNLVSRLVSAPAFNLKAVASYRAFAFGGNATRPVANSPISPNGTAALDAVFAQRRF